MIPFHMFKYCFLLLTSLSPSRCVIYGAGQVDAALFATGCLCELSSNYAQIAFEKVVDMANAMGSSPAMKLAAIRVFSKFGVSPHLSLGAHEVCP